MSEHKTFDPRVLLRGENSGGEVAIVDVVVPSRWAGPPLHRHDFDEAFYVLDGELTFQLDDELLTATRGQLAFARGGRVHTLANFRDDPASYLLIITPPDSNATSTESRRRMPASNLRHPPSGHTRGHHGRPADQPFELTP